MVKQVCLSVLKLNKKLVKKESLKNTKYTKYINKKGSLIKDKPGFVGPPKIKS